MAVKTSAGLFIAFEGGDGCGKSTQSQLLKERFEQAGRQVVLTREPGGTEMGKHIRGLLLHGQEIDPVTEALLYAADRAHHVTSLIRPALEAGKVVITDRFLASSIAYQGYGRGQDLELIADLGRIATGGLRPDLTFLLEVPPQTALGRIETEADRFEKLGTGFQEKVQAGFREIAADAPGSWVSIGGRRSIEDIANQIWDEVQRRGL